MVIAPQFIYISMMLPLNIPDPIFKQYDNLIRYFLWAGRKTIYTMSKMFVPKDKGGLDLPDDRLYSLSFEMAKIANQYRGTVSGLEWATIEKTIVAPFHSIIVISQHGNDTGNEINPIVKHSCEVCTKGHIMDTNQAFEDRTNTYQCILEM